MTLLPQYHTLGSMLSCSELDIATLKWLDNPSQDLVLPDMKWVGDRFDVTLGDTEIELHHPGVEEYLKSCQERGRIGYFLDKQFNFLLHITDCLFKEVDVVNESINLYYN